MGAIRELLAAGELANLTDMVLPLVMHWKDSAERVEDIESQKRVLSAV